MKNKRAGMFLIVALSVAGFPAAPSPADSTTKDKARADSIRRAISIIKPSLVTIETIGGAQPVRRMGPAGVVEESFLLAEGPTTGTVLASDGLILTSSFNFAREPSVITVTLADGRRFVAKLLGRDLIRRLALIRIDVSDLRPPAWLQRPDIAVGQYAIACGRGLGADTPQISLGIVSAVARRNGSAVQTDAKLSPVNYGGPLIDIEGRVIGLIVPMAGAGGALAGAEWYDSGIGFAVYRDRIDAVLEMLSTGRTIEPGKIGVILQPDESTGPPGADIVPWFEKLLRPTGVAIGKVAGKSPAAEANLQAGDRIIALDGRPIGEVFDLQRRLSDRAAGEVITLTIKRRWRSFDVTIRLARLADIEGLEPAPSPQPPLAASTQPDEEPPSTQPSAD